MLKLEKADGIENYCSLLFKMYIKFRGETKNLKAGEYFFQKGITPYQLIKKLVDGDVFLHEFTIIEGWTFNQMINSLQLQASIKKTITLDDPKKILELLGSADNHPEGLFFPDTYLYPMGTKDIDILKISYNIMQQHVKKLWNQKSDLKFNKPLDIITLASIIEKETARKEEKRLIAGVFHARLNKGMPLQTDPTVIYSLGRKFSGKLTRKDLKNKSLYNTYVHKGLPPTPISLPGLDSLEAAVNPQKTDFLYFVAKGDGSHIFSKDFTEHVKAVAKYQLGKKEAKSAN